MPLEANPLCHELTRHQHRRGQGLPTLSVLAGPSAAAGRAAWSAWCAAGGRPAVPVAGPALEPALDLWFWRLAEGRDWRATVAAPLARLSGLTTAECHARLGGLTAQECEGVLAWAVPDTLESPDAALVRWLVRAGAIDAPPPPLPSWQVLASAATLVPDQVVPGLLMGVEEAGEDGAPADTVVDRLAAVVPALHHLTTLAPLLPLALTVPAALLPRLRDRLPADRWRSWLAETTVTWPDPAPRAKGSTDSRTGPATMAFLARFGMNPATAALRRGLTSALIPTDAGFARSLAEYLMFQALEAIPETRGCFRLNQRLPILANGALAEIDLLADNLGLALEVDGPHHFAEDQYRRDRYRDFALQKAGYMIVRVLAADVFSDLDQCVSLVLQAAACQRDRPLPFSPP